MPKLSRVVWAALLALPLVSLSSAPAEAADRWWGGAALGLSFGGNVDYVSVEPTLGYWVNEKLTVGGRGILRYTNDDRSESQTDYGIAGFARFFPAKRIFIQGEYEWLSYERLVGGETDRDNYDSFLIGAGYSQPITKNSWFGVGAFYNLTWDEDEPSPYSDPWVFRGGLGFRF